MASTLIAMASDLLAMASNLIVTASDLVAMASSLIAMASNLAMAPPPTSDESLMNNSCMVWPCGRLFLPPSRDAGYKMQLEQPRRRAFALLCRSARPSGSVLVPNLDGGVMHSVAAYMEKLSWRA